MPVMLSAMSSANEVEVALLLHHPERREDPRKAETLHFVHGGRIYGCLRQLRAARTATGFCVRVALRYLT
jgi:hypothetical protein